MLYLLPRARILDLNAEEPIVSWGQTGETFSVVVRGPAYVPLLAQRGYRVQASLGYAGQPGVSVWYDGVNFAGDIATSSQPATFYLRPGRRSVSVPETGLVQLQFTPEDVPPPLLTCVGTAAYPNPYQVLRPIAVSAARAGIYLMGRRFGFPATPWERPNNNTLDIDTAALQLYTILAGPSPESEWVVLSDLADVLFQTSAGRLFADLDTVSEDVVLSVEEGMHPSNLFDVPRSFLLQHRLGVNATGAAVYADFGTMFVRKRYLWDFVELLYAINEGHVISSEYVDPARAPTATSNIMTTGHIASTRIPVHADVSSRFCAVLGDGFANGSRRVRTTPGGCVPEGVDKPPHLIHCAGPSKNLLPALLSAIMRAT